MDPAVLQARHDIRSAVAERLRDVEIKVREEATKVLGQSLKFVFAEIKTEEALVPVSASVPAPVAAASVVTSSHHHQKCLHLYYRMQGEALGLSLSLFLAAGCFRGDCRPQHQYQ